MPHNSVKLVPGVDENKTPALNEAGISTTNLIRFVPDRNNYGLVQKLGGWTKFYANTIGSIVRGLWAWEDTNSNSYLAIGAESSLDVLSNGNLKNITPQLTINSSVAVNFSTTAGSNIVTITDTGSNISSYDSVYIETQVSVGGLILFGLYPTIGVGPNTYEILAIDAFGNPILATSTTTGGAVPSFATTNGSGTITVTLANQPYLPGDTFPVLISTLVAGVTIFGNYIVQTASTNTFTITASTLASSTTSASENGGNAYFKYYIGIGPIPLGTGYGVGGYGRGGYGTGIPPVAGTGTPITATDWTLDNWGQILIACPANGPIYVWNPPSGTPIANVLTQAPVINSGMFVAMPQRQIIAYGSTFNGIQDPLLVRWCEVDDFTVWAAQITNQAGSYRIPKGSRIVGGIQGPQQGLIWTDLGCWAMQYVGLPYVYQFNEVGTGCGLIAKKAATSLNGTVYWMGQSQFFKLGANGVEPVACPIWDVIFQDLDHAHLDKIRVAPNSRFGEISWFYPTMSDGGEVNAYVKYNVFLQTWDFGTLSRTAWINESVLGPPIGADSNQYIQQHETSTDADGQPMLSSFQTGYFALQEADMLTFIDQVWPDMKWGYYNGSQNATVNLTFYVTNYPGDTPLVYGPYALTQGTEFITPRFRGRLVSIGVGSSDTGSFWRIGNMRYRFQPDGKF